MPLSSSWSMEVEFRPSGVDWKAERERVDLAALATSLLGPSPGRRGERGRRLWWRCPFHEDSNPSFCVEPGGLYWRCFGCGERGDAANLLMKLESISFPEAIRRLTGGDTFRPALPRNALCASPVRPQSPRSMEPTGLPREVAEALLEPSVSSLWGDEGKDALAYLRGRGLEDDTIKDARMGYVPSVSVPRSKGGAFRASGIVIPWFGKRGKLSLLKIRQRAGSGPKYVEAFRDPACLVGAYPGLGVVRPGRPLVVVEGELDCLIVAQELAEWGASVVTLGGASARPTGDLLGRMLMTSPWIIATDADEAGDKSAGDWPSSAIRLRPPSGVKDWSDAWKEGFNTIRYHFGGLIGPKPPESFWDEAWGPEDS